MIEIIKQEKRRERSDKGKVRFTRRDLIGLQWTAEQYAVRIDQLRRLIGREESGQKRKEARLISEASVRDLVRRWRDAKLVNVEKFFMKEPHWIWLTHDGLNLLGVPYKMYDPTLSSLPHIYWTNHVRLYIEEKYLLAQWKSEREIRSDKPKEGHPPDGEVELEGLVTAIEVELHRKLKAKRLLPILNKLATNSAYHSIQYFTLKETHTVVEKALSEVAPPLQKKFIVARLEDLV